VSKVAEANHARTHSNATPRAAHTRRARTWFTGVMPLVCSTALAAKFGVAAAAPVERTCDLRCSEQAVPHLSCLGEACWREKGCLSPNIAPANRVACSHILESTASPASCMRVSFSFADDWQGSRLLVAFQALGQRAAAAPA
jgi:hypothetical protein